MPEAEKETEHGEAAAAPEAKSSSRKSKDGAEPAKSEDTMSSAIATTPDPKDHALAVAESELEIAYLNRLAEINQKYAALRTKVTPTAKALSARLSQLELMHPAAEEALQTQAQRAKKAVEDVERTLQEATARVAEIQTTLGTAQADLEEKKKALPKLRAAAAHAQKALVAREKAIAANPWVTQPDVADADVVEQIERMIAERKAHLDSEKILYLQSLKADMDAELDAAKEENEASLKALKGP